MSYKTPYPIPRSGLGKGAIVRHYTIPNMAVTGVTGQTAQDAMTTSEFTDFGSALDLDARGTKQFLSGTIVSIRVTPITNTLSTPATIRTRKNGVNSNPLATIPAGSTTEVNLTNVGFTFAIGDIIGVVVTEDNSLNGQQLAFSMSIQVQYDG